MEINNVNSNGENVIAINLKLFHFLARDDFKLANDVGKVPKGIPSGWGFDS